MLLLLLSRFSRVQLCATPETAAHQAPLSLGFSRQEHWSGLPFPSPPVNHNSGQNIDELLSTYFIYNTDRNKENIEISSTVYESLRGLYIKHLNKLENSHHGSIVCVYNSSAGSQITEIPLRNCLINYCFSYLRGVTFVFNLCVLNCFVYRVESSWFVITIVNAMTLWPWREEILHCMRLLDFRVGPCYSEEQASQN